MDLITFVKKEEPVEYFLTIDEQGEVKDQLISKDVTNDKFTAIIKQEPEWSDLDNGNTDKSPRHPQSGRKFKLFKCDKCSAGYKSLRTLQRHIQNHNRKDKVQCKICKGFYYTVQLPLHIQMHTGPPYNCPICLKQFSMVHSWKQHCRIMHREKTFKCEKCQRSFLQKHALVDHMQIHEERAKNFTCKECGVRFYREESFARHLRKQHSHIPQQVYRCSNTSCNKIFRTNRFFQSHVCRRTKDKETLPKRIAYIKCPTCDCDLLTKKAYKDHQKLHRRELKRREYSTCSICQSQFQTKKALREHKSLHQQDRREAIRKRKNMIAKLRNCEKCNRNFKITDASYQMHLAQNCPENVTYECDHCSRLFSGKSAILGHLSQAHKNSFECDTCGSVFTKKVDIVQHILRLHSPKCYGQDSEGKFTCLKCSNEFADIHLYLEHMQDGNCENKFICKICGNRYPSSRALEKHELHHSVRYSCAHCGRTYHSKNSLKVHMQRGEHRTTFYCKFCHKIFLNKGSRNTHSWYHCPKNVGTFECDMCQSKYTKKAEIIKHMLVRHSPNIFSTNLDNTFTCGRCKAVFVGRDYFLNHVQSRNCVNKVRCEICSKVMTHSKFDKHHCGERIGDCRTFKCDQCDSTFKTNYTLLMHKRRGEHRTRFECDYCHKIFNGKGSYMCHYKNFCKKNKPPQRRPELPTNFECKCDRKFDNLGSYLTHSKYFCKMNQPDGCGNESGGGDGIIASKLPVVPIYKNLYGDY